MTSSPALLSHFVVLYAVPTGCIIAEIEGSAVYQLGLFPEDEQLIAFVASLFPELPVIALPAHPARLDDDMVLILGNRAIQKPGAE
ncbi:hypothetical protein [Cupriavidus sp. D39]|uniref:hypothetical protein n=1 Tax=Cupriavidus sp. D39 TaxID=2997877 RepID=UPI00226DD55F|nr:hypothetical protein [Cupriavidus sp. D39]MCY0853939.1 hypothetical protein [Cupriavidus sp. D39]